LLVNNNKRLIKFNTQTQNQPT